MKECNRYGMVDTELYQAEQLPSGFWGIKYDGEWIEASLPNEEEARKFIAEREKHLADRNYISIVAKPDPQYHRSEIILHQENMFYLAEFSKIEQLVDFAKEFGFTFTCRKTVPSERFEWYSEYDVDRKFVEGRSFWSLDEVPSGAKPFLGLSNGSIVTCYFVNDGRTISIYRPNPNAKEVYNPLSLREHIAHQMKFGKI